MLLKLIDLFTDSEPNDAYFELVNNSFALLNSSPDKVAIISCWFTMQVLKIHGGLPNVLEDTNGQPLQQDKTYSFSIEDGMFFVSEVGMFGANEIKAWRVFMQATPQQLMSISGLAEPAERSAKVLEQFALYQT